MSDDDPPRVVDVRRRWAEDLVRFRDRLRVDERLPVEAEVCGLTTGLLEAGVVVEIEVHAVQRGDPRRACREHAELEAREEWKSARALEPGMNRTLRRGLTGQ